MDISFATKAPFIIFANVLLLHITGYFAQQYFSAEIVWLVVGIIDAFFGFRCGLYIRSIFKDELTGLYNRSFLALFLKRVMLDMRVKEASVSLLMVDIDDFKHVNDTYGHLVGDIVLKQIGAILQKSIRKTDCVVRWGGEEFAIVLPETDRDGAVRIAERLRQSVEGFDFNSSPVILKLTVSIGAVSLCDKVEQADLIRQADKALYQAKQTKNIVVFV